MRTFLAVTPDPASCRAIDNWRVQCWPVIDRAIPAHNYHITLAFLGDISTKQREKLESLVDGINVEPFAMQLDDVGYWPGAECLWLGASMDNKALHQLATTCTMLANRANIRVSKKTFRPHLTLARKVKLPPSPPLITPDFSTAVATIELYQSLRERSGARYIELRSFPFCGSNSGRS